MCIFHFRDFPMEKRAPRKTRRDADDADRRSNSSRSTPVSSSGGSRPSSREATPGPLPRFLYNRVSVAVRKWKSGNFCIWCSRGVTNHYLILEVHVFKWKVHSAFQQVHNFSLHWQGTIQMYDTDLKLVNI